MQNCKDTKFKNLAPLILKPLASVLSQAKVDESEERIALASVYVGMLSFHLLIPSSPLDPGMKLAAKVAEWSSYLHSLGSELVAIIMESGLSTGNFYPDTPAVVTLTKEADYATSKQIKQDKKRVERPQDIPPFHQLFREVQHFSKTIGNVGNILNLLNSFCEEKVDQKHSSFQAMEINWQSSASAFFKKIVLAYACYEDVTSPFLAALGMIQNGIRNYAHCKLANDDRMRSVVLTVQDNLLQYPNVSNCKMIEMKSVSFISDAFDCHNMKQADEQQGGEKMVKKCKFSFLMASLSHLFLLKSANLLKHETWVKYSSWLFGSISKAWNLASEKQVLDESEEERNERQYREHVPDHGKEFAKIFESAENPDEDLSEDATDRDDDAIVDNVSISD